MSEWRNIRAVASRVGGYFALVSTGWVAHVLLSGCAWFPQ